MTRPCIVAAAVALAACSGDDPLEGVQGLTESCLYGSVRDPGPACTVPDGTGIAIDGYVSDWPIAPFHYVCPDCTFGAAIELAVFTRDHDSFIAWLQTIGAPEDRDRYFYALEFRHPDMVADDPRNIYTTYAFGVDEDVTFVGDYPVRGVPATYAFGPRGVEVRVPIAALPYDGEALVSPVIRFWNGSGFGRTSAAGFSIFLCWDRDKLTNTCEFF